MSNRWIEWKGGPCPVPLDDTVDVHLRSGAVTTGRAGHMRWPRARFEEKYLADSDIVAYHIFEEEEPYNLLEAIAAKDKLPNPELQKRVDDLMVAAMKGHAGPLPARLAEQLKDTK